MAGLLFLGVFVAVVLDYACTEFLLGRLDGRRRVLVGEGRTFLIILTANFASFLILWVSAVICIAASGMADYLYAYVYATIVCACIQAIWLVQHLWFYYRDHPRLRYEQ